MPAISGVADVAIFVLPTLHNRSDEETRLSNKAPDDDLAISGKPRAGRCHPSGEGGLNTLGDD